MMGLIVALHVVVCLLLIGIILIQRGRGGGLVDTFSDMESMFGTKTNAFLTRTTTVLSVLFFITCLSLAFISSRQARSLIPDTAPQQSQAAPLAGASGAQPQQPQNEKQEAPKPETK